jgi:geranyl-CoA carboxylase alpha subunit
MVPVVFGEESMTERQNRQTPPRLIRKVLVANRGEIACRVMCTCRSMGIATVAVYSDADAEARHVHEAGEAIRIGESPAVASYLNIPAIIQAARRSGADAVHPGYGFLSENADFAAACRDAGLIFIGPDPEVIRRMGSKREAKLLVAAAGIPVVPGYSGEDQADNRFTAAAREIGYPVLIKASAGGGGKGMRAIEHEDELPQALAAARREARAAFGDDTLLLEKLIAAPRHVEFQIFGDEYGSVIHLGERECSIQRRHQKVVEETPSTALTPELRVRMGEAAVTVGRRLGYTNAGTVEFVLDPAGSFYFLEVNTRLQVEHPVTELVTGLDLVRWQIEVAEGRPLPLTQEQVRARGHAVEVRLYAEEPANGFLPSTGPVVLWREPEGDGVRVDAGIASGDEITPYYDPMLAKIVTHGADRDEALRRLDRALANTLLFGVRNNLEFLRRVLLHPDHRAGRISTAFIDQHAGDLAQSASNVRESGHTERLAAALAAVAGIPSAPHSGRWRNNPSRPHIERFEPIDGRGGEVSRSLEVRLSPRGQGHFAATTLAGGGEEAFDLAVHGDLAERGSVEVGGHRLRAVVASAGDDWWVCVGETTHHLRRLDPLHVPAAAFEAPGRAGDMANGHRTAPSQRRDGALAAPMPGLVVSVLVEAGQAVSAGDPLFILEAMKMEHTIRAPRDATVEAVRVAAGDQVQPSAVLLDFR